jgi:predicted RecB family endonuclease
MNKRLLHVMDATECVSHVDLMTEEQGARGSVVVKARVGDPMR